MGRRRLYATDAERQQAYRDRLTSHSPPTPQPKPSRKRQPSRPAKLAASQQVLQDLKNEYEAWLESLPEPLQDGPQAERVAETIEQLDTVLDLIADIQPPRGFGRD